MTDVKTIAAQRAAGLLKTAGLDFAIILPSGEQLGELAVKPRRKNGAPRCDFKHTGYRKVLDGMAVGDVQVFPADEGMDVKSYRSAISAGACSRWGKGSHIITINGNSVEIMRTEVGQATLL